MLLCSVQESIINLDYVARRVVTCIVIVIPCALCLRPSMAQAGSMNVPVAHERVSLSQAV